jgi:hypothetical protein
LSALTIDRLIALLTDYVRQTEATVDIILIGGLALQAYGDTNRATQDVDGELIGDLGPLVRFLADHQIPADLGENISGWSVIAMPPGYRERASILLEQPNLRLRLLDPRDFIVSKLRRGTDLDLDDAASVAKRFHVAELAVRAAAGAAVAASPADTTLFMFRKTVDLFCARLSR